MFRAQVSLGLVLAAAAAGVGCAADFSGESALAYAQHAVDYGPRPSGSAQNRQLQRYILSQLEDCGCEVTEDQFTAATPRGEIGMNNIIAKFPGSSGKAIAITGHYDTKLYPGRRFLGANDGASSTGLLLELADALQGQPRIDDVYLVWFDGEEAVRPEWAGTDNLYGSRHLAGLWLRDGTLGRLKALINVDMIGDRQLNIPRETNSNATVREVIWSAAADLGYSATFLPERIAIEDDHLPFLDLGAPAVDIIDFDYPYWHEDSDTMDKLSARSLEIVGRVMLESIRRLER